MASVRKRGSRYSGLYRDATGKQKSAGTFATEREALKAAEHAEAVANPPDRRRLRHEQARPDHRGRLRARLAGGPGVA